VQKNQQDAKETQVHPIFFLPLPDQKYQSTKTVTSSLSKETQYEQLNSPRPASAASTNNEQGPHFSKAAFWLQLWPILSPSSCYWWTALSIQERFPSRPPPTSAASALTSQLPYEYVVPPPGFYNGSNINVTGNMLRHNGSRHYAE
jgi:hypothetical protein